VQQTILPPAAEPAPAATTGSLPPLPAQVVSTPPAAEPAPAPVRKRRSAAEPAPAQTVAATVAPEPAPAPATVAVAAPVAGVLSLFAPKPGFLAAAKAAHAAAQAGRGEPNIFATVELTGGQGGGMLDKCGMNVEGSDADLPQGRDPFYAMLLGWRFVPVVWPGEYDDNQKQQPLWKAQIGADQFDLYQRYSKAHQRCQFCPKEKRSAFAGLGTVSGHLELLLFEEEAGMMVARTARTYGSVDQTYQAILGVYPSQDIQPVPVQVTPTTVDVQTKGRSKPFPEHHFGLVLSATEQAGTAYRGFQAFGAQLAGNPDAAAAFAQEWAAWHATTITDGQARLLDEIAAVRY
jgi:hypothetical protein